jgi:hypothetical protein
MNNIEELKDVLRVHLEEKGSLDRIRSELRAQVYATLSD